MTISCFYDGSVTHQRARPIKHRLRYRIFMAFLDLDELPSLGRRLRLFSHERFNLFSFFDSDHGDGVRGGLRAWVEQHLRAAGVESEGGAIRVLCMPRVLGHVFNPISIFYCFAENGSLAAMLYEVNNTFGERHSYLIPVRQAEGPIRQTCEKAFYVSPFMPMRAKYRFRVTPPEARVSVAITAADADGPLIATAFAGARSKISDVVLLRAFLRMPLLGLKVVAGIHWEALKLFVRGLRLQAKPAPPTTPVSISL